MNKCLSRRRLIAASSLVMVGSLGASHVFIRRQKTPAWMTAATDQTQHCGVVLTSDLEIRNSIPLPARAHGTVFNRLSAEAIFIARRPENWLVIANTVKGNHYSVNASPNRHFYGHGIFETDSQLLLTTENTLGNGDGVIGVRDATQGYRWVREFPSYGIGPHEIAWMPDRRALVVANGGLLTQPNAGRTPLNLNTMAPNISVIAWPSGELLQQYFPGNSKMSLRHLAVTASGVIVVGAQFQGGPLNRDSLVIEIDPTANQNGHAPTVPTPDDFSVAIQQYTASVCAMSVHNSNRVAISCPKGNRLAFFADRHLLHQLPIQDVAGVASTPTQQELVYTSGTGEVGKIQFTANGTPLITTRHQFSRLKWDNHLYPAV